MKIVYVRVDESVLPLPGSPVSFGPGNTFALRRLKKISGASRRGSLTFFK
jgi:hypothetical protein